MESKDIRTPSKFRLAISLPLCLPELRPLYLTARSLRKEVSMHEVDLSWILVWRCMRLAECLQLGSELVVHSILVFYREHYKGFHDFASNWVWRGYDRRVCDGRVHLECRFYLEWTCDDVSHMYALRLRSSTYLFDSLKC